MDLRTLINNEIVPTPLSYATVRAETLDYCEKFSLTLMDVLEPLLDGLPRESDESQVRQVCDDAIAYGLHEKFGMPLLHLEWIGKRCMKHRKYGPEMRRAQKTLFHGSKLDWTEIGYLHISVAILSAVRKQMEDHIETVVADRATAHEWIRSEDRRSASTASSGDRATM